MTFVRPLIMIFGVTIFGFGLGLADGARHAFAQDSSFSSNAAQSSQNILADTIHNKNQDDKINALSDQLSQAIALIKQQSQEMARLRDEVDGLKAAQAPLSAAKPRHSGGISPHESYGDMPDDENIAENSRKKQIPAIATTQYRPAQYGDAHQRSGVSGGVDDRLARVEETLKYVEDAVIDLDDRSNGRKVANVFDADRLNIGGFFNTALTFVDADGGSATAFNRQNFELLIRADLDDQWSAFFAGGFLREGDITFTDSQARRNPDFSISNSNPEIIAWFNYKHNEQFNLRLGRIITPHGIVNIEHFPATLLDQEQPQFLRPFSGDTIFPNFTTGAEAHGQFFFGDNILSYNLYGATAQSDPEELLYGGRLAYEFSDIGVTFGVNALTGKRDEGGADSRYQVFGADVLYDKGPLLWKTEIYATDEKLGDSRFAFYTQPAWRINDQWIAFYRYDYLDDGNATGGVNDNETIENVLGVNYLPRPNVRLRLTGTRREFESGGAFDDAEADIVQFSATYSF